MSINSSNKYLITQTLLSSYEWIFKSEDGYEDFLKTLRREPFQQNKAMLDGIHFENMVYARVGGAPPSPKNQWHEGVETVYGIVKDAALQVKLYRDISVGKREFVLYGILDALYAGHIYDIKFSKNYYRGKYLKSPQHPMYFKLCPEAIDFIYISSDGDETFQERYEPQDCDDISDKISEFLRFIEREKLEEDFTTNWKSKY
jgi:hypothetical protein